MIALDKMFRTRHDFFLYFQLASVDPADVELVIRQSTFYAFVEQGMAASRDADSLVAMIRDPLVVEFPLPEQLRQWAVLGLWSPLIQLTDYWELSDRAWRQPKDMALCGWYGHSLFFFAPLVDAMPDKHVEELIAHELAHVTHWAVGEHPRTDRSVPRWCDSAESIADEIMEDLWGFEAWPMDEWLEKNWKWPT